MLNFESSWRFESPGPIKQGVADTLSTTLQKLRSSQMSRQSILEHFKGNFANAAGLPHHVSSSESWAITDLDGLMTAAAANAPLFIEAFFETCGELRVRDPQMALPDTAWLNRVLAENAAGYQIADGRLLATGERLAISVPEQPLSLDLQARELIATSLSAAEKALAAGHGRQAVQESLWLLETISTAFRGTESSGGGSVQGAYFNKIIRELRLDQSRGARTEILKWMMTLHGFLSSPTGGGIRHGIDLTEGAEAIEINQARLYCNLIRSYVAFLISEHERIKAAPANSR